MNCLKCGAPLLPDAAFCINCGTPVVPAGADETAADTPLEGNTTPELTVTPSGDPLFGEDTPAVADTTAEAASLEGNTTPELTLTPSGDPLFGEDTPAVADTESTDKKLDIPAEADAEIAAEKDNEDTEETLVEETAEPSAEKTAAPAESESVAEPSDEPADAASEPVAGDAASTQATSEPAGESAAAPAQPATDEKNRFCMGCGAPLEPNVAFCTECGMPVGASPAAPTPPAAGGASGPMPPYAAKSKPSTPVIIVIILCAVLLVALIVGLVIFAARGASSASASSKAASSEAVSSEAAPTPTDALPASPAPAAAAVTPGSAPHLSSLTITYVSVAGMNDSYTYNDTPSSLTYYFDSSNRLIRVVGIGNDETGAPIQVADCTVSYAADGTPLPDSTCYPRYNAEGVLESACFTETNFVESNFCVTRFAPDGSVTGFLNCEPWFSILTLDTDWTFTVPYTRDADGKIIEGTAVSDCRDGEYQFTTSATYGDAPSPTAPGTSNLNLSNVRYNITPLCYRTTANHGLIIRQGPGTDTERLGSIPYDSQIYVLATNTATSEWVLMTWYSPSLGHTEMGWVNTEYIEANYFS